jgi:hypothetical protein
VVLVQDPPQSVRVFSSTLRGPPLLIRGEQLPATRLSDEEALHPVAGAPLPAYQLKSRETKRKFRYQNGLSGIYSCKGTTELNTGSKCLLGDDAHR